MDRSAWTVLTDKQLLGQCKVDTYRASGPGGQKRNKTSSAIRLRHPPSGLLVIAEESRSQHENRARALKRLRQGFFAQIREDLSEDSLQLDALRQAHPELDEVRDSEGKFHVNRKNPRFWSVAGIVLDVFFAVEARISEAAQILGTSTGNLVDFLQTEEKVWEQANLLREKFGLKPLR